MSTAPCEPTLWRLSLRWPCWREQGTVALAIFALASLLVLHLCQMTFVDPDMWHEMSLAREAIDIGRLPLEDRFAYTPTVLPSVHHEWGAGFILYGVATTLGAPGIMTLKYALTATVWGLCFLTARRRGASFPVIASLAPVAILCGVIGFTTIRAQLFTLVALAAMLCMLESDRRGGRRWMGHWLILYVVWLNVHAGFIVGAALLAAYVVEQAARGQNVMRFVWLAVAMAALVFVNPYGWHYVPYLAEAITMPRPLITEWNPLWQTDPAMFQIYMATLLLALYSLAKLGPRRMPGLLMLVIAAIAAARHTRHLSLYLVVWLAYVPSYVQQTPLGQLIDDVWTRRRGWVAGFWIAVAVVSIVRAAPASPFTLQLPNSRDDEWNGRPAYPVGAVDYLDRVGFRGNLMAPFVNGGYVMWKLHPRVKVSMDGRYEVAYQPGILEENVAFYAAKPGWQDTLSKYPTDAVLLPCAGPLAEALQDNTDWPRVYRDKTFEIRARPGLTLPHDDAPGRDISPRFP